MAMAAIQLGIPKRIVYIKSTKPNDTTANAESDQILMINPEIISKKGRTEVWEACVSGLENFGLVERPYEIVVKYQNENGELLTGIQTIGKDKYYLPLIDPETFNGEDLVIERVENNV